ncbi:MAG: zf-HC2 domain-containing protein [Myxococcales bacterium]|nr:MAG: zf-HC2 domain-containing protein [Myxococcales bacterium]
MAAERFSGMKRAVGPRVRNGVRQLLRPIRRVAWVDQSLRDSLDYLLECHVVRRHLSDLYDGRLPRWRSALVRAHLATCTVCPQVDVSMRETIDLLHRLKDDALDPLDPPP